MSNDYRAAIDAGLAALRARDMTRAAELLRPAALVAPADAFPWIALANAEQALGKNEAAEAALDQQLLLNARDIGALLMRGWLREQAGDARAATTYYQAARNQAAVEGKVPPALAALHDHAGRYAGEAGKGFEEHLLAAVGTGLSPAMTEAVELLTGKRELYLQQPTTFYYPGLPQRRFFDPNDYPWFVEMIGKLPAMQAELVTVLEESEGFTPYVHRTANRPAPNNPLLDKQDWSAFHFWKDGARVIENAARCPATMEALDYAPLPCIPGRSPNAHWSRLLPGAHILPHHGMLNTRLICHLPILTAPACSLRVGSETRGWEAGVPLVFDDSIEHEAKNAGPQQRVVLLFEIWRPEIDDEDRTALGRIFQAIDSYGA